MDSADRVVLSLSLSLAVLAFGRPLAAGPRDVIIDEIHYNVFEEGEDERLEFIELYNSGATAVDLSGWFFSRGIDYTFADGASIAPKTYLVLSPDPAFARVRYGLERSQVFGPYTGRLENNGEVLELVDARGRYGNRVHYDDGGAWPARPDGRGPSLEFTGADNDNDLAHRWKPSLVRDGTPGRPNSRREVAVEPPAPAGDTVLVAEDAIWRAFRGRSNPSTPLGAWTEAGFDDGAWESLAGPFGYGDDHDFTFTTLIGDMRFRYTTLFIRRGFELDAATLAAAREGGRLILDVTFDDGFVAYLNGQEVARRNLGQEGEAVAFNATAASSLAESTEIEITPFAVVLAEGPNVLAVAGANSTVFSGDFFLGAGLRLESGGEDAGDQEEPPSPFIGGVINELRPSSGGGDLGAIELFNPTGEPLDLSGHFLLSSRGDFVHEIVGALVIEPLGFALLDARELRFPLPAAAAKLVLLAADGVTIVDDIEVRAPSVGRSAGRFPDGDEDVFVFEAATLGAPNQHELSSPVVINEINFHPPFVPAGGDCARNCSDAHQWLELHNRTGAAVDLSGWALTSGVEFELPAGTTLAAGGYLVVAASVDAFRALHPGVEGVIGPWVGRLNHASEAITLRDALGNRADRVVYGDGRPWNDEAPADGVNDRTFRGSEWPAGADGEGPTLELVHPSLAGRAGMAWRASLAPGGTPGARNSTFEENAPPAIRGVEHTPAVPRSDHEVLVRCRIASVAALASASVHWAVDGGGPAGSAALRDDGAGGDGTAGDGEFTATLPPQPDGTVVRFQIEARDAAGSSSRLPLEPEVRPYNGYPGTFFLYEVDDSRPVAGGSPLYRVIMTESDLAQLEGRAVTSNVLLPATFIAGDEVRHVSGLRYRGENSRRAASRSYKLRFPPEHAFEGVDNINLNAGNGGTFGTSSYTELLALDLYRRAGAPYAQAFPVVLHFAGEVSRDFDRRYIRKEAYDSDFLARFFGASDYGPLFRARNPGGPGQPSGDFAYRGEDETAYRPLYVEESNSEESDYGSIIALTRLFDRTQTPDDAFADAAEELIDPRQWAQFFAVMACLSNVDGGIWNNNGEDFFLYRVPEGSPRPDAGKWLLLAWDLEETFTSSTERLFRPTVPSIVRFLSEPRFARLYYEELFELRDGPFSRFEMSPRLLYAEKMFAPQDVFDVVDAVDTTIAERLGYYDERIARSVEGGAAEDETGGDLVIDAGDTWRFFRGRQNPGAGWMGLGFDDSQWETGASGFGYGDGDDATVLGDMQGSYTTVYARRIFEVADPQAVRALTLFVDYDDAFVAYINGTEVARAATAPAGADIRFDMTATASHEASLQGQFERFDAGEALPVLLAGPNVIAIVGLNVDLPSSDFSLIPRLAISVGADERGPAGGCGVEVFATGGSVVLRGLADPVATYSVRVGPEMGRVALVTGGNGPYGASWEGIVEGLDVGRSRVVVAALDAAGDAVSSAEFEVERVAGPFRALSGPLAAASAWSAADGPYRLAGNVEVPAGGSLVIGPGTTVLADAGASLIVRGVLTAEGTEEAPIVFRAYDCSGDWGGIAFASTGAGAGAPTHVLRYCDLSGGSEPAGFGGAVSVDRSRVRLEQCRLHDLSSNAVDATAAYVEVVACRFEDIFEGIHSMDSTTIVLESRFDNIKGNSDAIDFDGSGSERSRIERCFLSRGSDDGVDLGNVTVDVRDNVFADIGDKAVSTEGPGAQGHPRITGNLFYRCGTGMAIKDGVQVSEGDHNTVVYCRYGIHLFAKDEAPQGGQGDFHSVIVWNNVFDVTVDARSSVRFSYSDVGGDEPWEGEGNIFADPRFVAPEGGDFALAPDSPCIGSGRDGTDMGAVPLRGGTEPVTFVRGDVNTSGRVDIADPIAALDYLFRGTPGPTCLDRVDANDDGQMNLTDAVHALLFLFAQGAPVPPPYPEAGVDPTADDLACE